MKRILWVSLVWSCLAATGWTQILLQDLSQRTPADLVNVLVGQGIVISNVVYTGTTNASGSFCGGESVAGFKNGIVLTSGSITNIIGPNDSPSATSSNGAAGDSSLDGLIPGFQTFDAAVLEFDFIPQGSAVQFRYTFGSEEYNEFVDTAFNDVFGFFVNGVNYALIPGTATPVSINNINNGNHDSSGVATGPCNNCQFFIDNTAASPVRNTQLDGLTTVLTFTAPVTPGVLNHLKIAIADAGDFAYDSAVFIEAGSFSSASTTSNCVTRDARFWFSHPREDSPGCVNLRAALLAEMRGNCDLFDLGFMSLPAGYRNNDNVRDVEDALLEALGLYWRSRNRTGEISGTQGQKLSGSKLCRERKRLATELIAAIANVRVFGTDPTFCNFPATLIDDARAAAAGDRIEAIQNASSLLRQFNSSGTTNDFPAGLFECAAPDKNSLKSESRDPTLQSTCPGVNDSCTAAEALYFKQGKAGILSQAKLSRRAVITSFADDILSPTCAQGGADVVWKLTPDVAKAARHFTLDTFGSNFDTLLSVHQGSCSALTEVTCSDDSEDSLQSKVAFTADGTNTYFVVVEGKNGSVGKVKLKVTSP